MSKDRGKLYSPVLVVQAEGPDRDDLVAFLQRGGHACVCAGNGATAMAAVQGQYFPVVILDRALVRETCAEVCNAIRDAEHTGYSFILLLACFESVEEVIDGLEAGADDLLMKPFTHAQIVARLNIAQRLLDYEVSLAKAEEDIQVLVTMDKLTGVFSGHYLKRELPREVSRALRLKQPFSIILCDIDRLRDINNTHGFDAGDKALAAFAAVLGPLVRGEVDWLARFAGEEFVVVLPSCTPDESLLLAERMRDAVSACVVPYHGESIRMTASFAVSGFEGGSCPDDAVDMETLLTDARNRLNDCKSDGGNAIGGQALCGV